MKDPVWHGLSPSASCCVTVRCNTRFVHTGAVLSAFPGARSAEQVGSRVSVPEGTLKGDHKVRLMKKIKEDEYATQKQCV